MKKSIIIISILVSIISSVVIIGCEPDCEIEEDCVCYSEKVGMYLGQYHTDLNCVPNGFLILYNPEKNVYTWREQSSNRISPIMWGTKEEAVQNAIDTYNGYLENYDRYFVDWTILGPCLKYFY